MPYVSKGKTAYRSTKIAMWLPSFALRFEALMF
jgi:hypothetical protein